jgi:hypothetical protein
MKRFCDFRPMRYYTEIEPDGITRQTMQPTELDTLAEPGAEPGAPPPPRLFRYASHGAEALAGFAQRFEAARPFPHLVLDDFLALPQRAVVDAFPGVDWPHWRRFTDAYQHQKMHCGEIERLPSLFQAMIAELSSPSFLGFLERVTGINGLIPDPYLSGGGLHSSGPGGILAPHTDFHSYGRLGLFRRINVLVYFNPDWQEAFGGCLELSAKGAATPSHSIVPIFGRMVMFLTDDRSVHGFSRPILGPGRWRNSLALYYYTSEDTDRFSGDGETYWQAHGQLRGKALVRLLAYKVLLRGAWSLSKLAHRVNPNFRPGSAPAGGGGGMTGAGPA